VPLVLCGPRFDNSVVTSVYCSKKVGVSEIALCSGDSTEREVSASEVAIVADSIKKRVGVTELAPGRELDPFPCAVCI
jgi:hypothetical protein